MVGAVATIVTTVVTHGKVAGARAAERQAGKRPTVVVLHQWCIERGCRQLGVAGFIQLADAAAILILGRRDRQGLILAIADLHRANKGCTYIAAIGGDQIAGRNLERGARFDREVAVIIASGAAAGAGNKL